MHQKCRSCILFREILLWKLLVQLDLVQYSFYWTMRRVGFFFKLWMWMLRTNLDYTNYNTKFFIGYNNPTILSCTILMFLHEFWNGFGMLGRYFWKILFYWENTIHRHTVLKKVSPDFDDESQKIQKFMKICWIISNSSIFLAVVTDQIFVSYLSTMFTKRIYLKKTVCLITFNFSRFLRKLFTGS